VPNRVVQVVVIVRDAMKAVADQLSHAIHRARILDEPETEGVTAEKSVGCVCDPDSKGMQENTHNQTDEKIVFSSMFHEANKRNAVETQSRIRNMDIAPCEWLIRVLAVIRDSLV
jgi:hypothetical protein